MKANQLATLVLRLIGVYFIAQTVIEFPLYGLEAITELGGRYGQIAIETLTGLAATTVIGVLLIVFSALLGKKLAPNNSSDEGISAITFKQAQTLAFAIAGVLIFANTLPQLFNSIFNLLRATTTDTYQVIQPGRRDVELAVGVILKTTFGIWLFFGAEGFANFWGSLRNFATPKPPQAG